VNEALATDDMKALLAKQGAEPSGGTPEAFSDQIKGELKVWNDVVKKTGIKID
jgi:tripartite-type tricarboxylate transporter receptor subunit TctC